ncbi:TlpA family protein disulfide reductase [Pedobacter sp. MW01-1-1]|uniref:TlpA family protein disulfide reductase n=1 Tax=Pedobacter sp. MW01-1-1 TaxID=3383027 RepID=UPI003FEF2DFC
MLKKIFLLGLISAFSFNLFAQYTSSFKYLPEKPQNGKMVSISYDASNTKLVGKTNVRAVVYQYIDYKWIASDLKLIGQKNLWKADLKLADKCGIVALKFVADTLVDNNDNEGFFFMLHDKDRAGLMAPGAYAGWGLARSPKYDLDIPNYMHFKGVSDSATYHWLNQEISFNQSSKSALVYPYSVALVATFKESSTPRLQRVLAYLKRPDASENDLLNARRILQTLLKDQNTVDSVEKVLNQKFPNGSLTRLNAYKEVSMHRDIKSLLAATLKFLNDFPEYKTNKEFDVQNRIYYSNLYQSAMVFGAMEDKNTPYVAKYVDSVSFTALPTVYYKLITISYDRKQDYNVLSTYADLLVKRFEYFRDHQPESMLHLSPLEWKKEYNHVFATNVTRSYLGLLNFKKNYLSAIKYAAEAEQDLKFSNAAINNEYAYALKQAGKVNELDVVLKKSMFLNQASTEMIGMIKEKYVKKHGSEKGFEAYLTSLKNPEDQKKGEVELKASMIKKDMPQWSMQDLNGKTVKSSDLIGKTVVLDFWATWCVPCKASFPGMKLAVEKYKNDPNVVFYFVDTEESSSTYKTEIAAYIKDNKYPFQVLFDNKAEGEKTNAEVFTRICKEFTISGIPQKLIIDKNGKLRFISIGFKGSATGLADEISSLIELTKKAE